VFVIVVVLIFTFDHNGTPLDNPETAQAYSLVTFDVHIIAIWSVSPFSGR
jgi:hypothetical protein